ncbi:MAG: hypothetical protein MUF81_06010 [Verrucomicrobia bacterium]|jgi:hypothetical protein|nr:hypothetical protein [Verrucomicrobiota bacterium]
MNRNRKTKRIIWAGAMVVAVFVLGTILWKRRFHDYTPAAAVLDLRAGFEARHAPVPAKQFLELRYGPQTDPANRRAAFIDFFNAGHIEGLYLIVGNRTDPRTRKGIADVAQILRDYRGNMSPDEKKALADHFNSEAGRAQVQAATASYQSKSARYRAVTAPVINELLTTLAAIQNQ